MSPETLRYYKWVRRAFLPILAKPTKTGMLDCIAKLLADGVSPISVNTYLRGLKAYSRWLKSENLLRDDFKVQFLKTEQKVLQTFSPEHISRLIHWKPVRCSEKRLHAITMVLLDTGLRCQEVLTLRKDDLDFDNLILRVHGKGNKQRLVPMSLELRKILYRHVHRANGELIFCTRDGGKLSQRNLLRDLKILAKRLSISGGSIFGTHVSPYVCSELSQKRGERLLPPAYPRAHYAGDDQPVREKPRNRGFAGRA